jgi:hypothetical protein
MQDDTEDKKFFPQIIVKYSPTIFSKPMPAISVGLKGIPQPLQALVDSGSTNSLINYDWAKQANFNIDTTQKYGGGGVCGGYEYYLSDPVEVSLFGYKYNIKFDVLIGNDPIWACILGQDSIFRLAKITFKRYRSEFQVAFRKDIN